MEQTLGKRIMQNRKRLGLTQEQLAEKLEVSAQAVSKWENDQTCPDITMLPRLAEIFGITTDALLGREAPVFEAEVVNEEPERKGSDISGNINNWEFHWDSGRKSALGFAIFVLVVGGLYLASQLLSWEYNLWDIAWPTALLTFGLFGLFPKFSFFSLGCALFGGYFLADLFIDIPLQLEGGVIWAVIIVIFGLSLLADALKRPKKPRFQVSYKDKNGNKNQKSTYDFQSEEDTFTYNASFGEAQQVVDLATLRGGDVNVSFGDYTLKISGETELTDDCTITANCSFGQLTILVPRKFEVKPFTANSFAGFEVIGQPDPNPMGYIRLESNCSFGQTEVKYI